MQVCVASLFRGMDRALHMQILRAPLRMQHKLY